MAASYENGEKEIEDAPSKEEIPNDRPERMLAGQSNRGVRIAESGRKNERPKGADESLERQR